RVHDPVPPVRPAKIAVGIGAPRFELRTPCAQGRCATRLRYAPTETRRPDNIRHTRGRVKFPPPSPPVRLPGVRHVSQRPAAQQVAAEGLEVLLVEEVADVDADLPVVG